MSTDAIVNLADKAARVVLGGKPWYTPEDWQDAAQEAALKLWRVSQERDDVGEGYLFNAARIAIYDWLRTWLDYRRDGTILDYLDYAADEPAAPDLDAQIDALAPRLDAARGKRHNAAWHVAQELAYLKLVCRGVSTDGIAMELGLSRRNVYAIRERLVPRLTRIAAGAA